MAGFNFIGVTQEQLLVQLTQGLWRARCTRVGVRLSRYLCFRFPRFQPSAVSALAAATCHVSHSGPPTTSTPRNCSQRRVGGRK